MSLMNTIRSFHGVAWARPMSLPMVFLALTTVVVITLVLYRRLPGVPSRVRQGLACARFVVLVLLLLSLFEPYAVFEKRALIKRRLPVLVDVSESMSIVDHRKLPDDVLDAAVALDVVAVTGTNAVPNMPLSLNSAERESIAAATRLELAANLLTKAARPIFDRLNETLDVEYYAFGKDVRMLATHATLADEDLQGLSAADTGTAIADSLEAIASASGDPPLAGIVLLSDGVDTSSRRTESTLDDLGIQGIPVFTVPIGLSDPDDVSIRNIIMQEVAFSGDKVPVRVQIKSKGYEKRGVALNVRLNGRRVAREDVTLSGGLQFEEIYFNVDIHEKGAAEIEISVEPFADEATAENNSVTRSVRVVNERINVLCIEGSPRWEYRYLRAMLKRDPRINATFIATRSGPEIARNSSEYIARFPERREDAFQYDLVILGDVDAAFFSGDALLRIEELVRDRGGALLMLCGSRYAPTSYAGTPIEKMLPVVFESEGEWQDVPDSAYPVLTPEGRSSLVMTLETDREMNDRVWSRVAPLDRVPPLLEARPGSAVLMTLSDSGNDVYPLVAWQRYGTGKCMSIGSDRFWLLRFKTGDKYHWRVWSQCIQFLSLSRLMGEHKRIRLETDRAIYPVGGQVQLYAHLLDERYEPLIQAGFEIEIISLDQPDRQPQRMSLRPDAETPGLYEGFFAPSQAGRYRIEASDADRSLSNTTEFQVADVRSELATTEMRMASLERISEISGGVCLGIRSIDQLAAGLDGTPHETVYRAQIALWDNSLMLLLLLVLMGGEWIVRRKYDLP